MDKFISPQYLFLKKHNKIYPAFKNIQVSYQYSRLCNYLCPSTWYQLFLISWTNHLVNSFNRLFILVLFNYKRYGANRIKQTLQSVFSKWINECVRVRGVVTVRGTLFGGKSSHEWRHLTNFLGAHSSGNVIGL